MRPGAPSVSYPVGRCRFWEGCLAGLVLGVGTLSAFLLASLPLGAWLMLAAAGLVWMAAAARSGRRQARGVLRFGGASGQGGGWRWSADAADEGVALDAVEASLDLQGRMLLHLKGAAGVPSWVWVERARAPANWLALRRAIAADRML